MTVGVSVHVFRFSVMYSTGLSNDLCDLPSLILKAAHIKQFGVFSKLSTSDNGTIIRFIITVRILYFETLPEPCELDAIDTRTPITRYKSATYRPMFTVTIKASSMERLVLEWVPSMGDRAL